MHRIVYCTEPGSSVSVVYGYGLDDRAIEVPSPAEAKDFSSNLCVQTGSEAHPASCPAGTGGKTRPGRDADHSPHLVTMSRISRSYNSSSPRRLRGVALTYITLWSTSPSEAESCSASCYGTGRFISLLTRPRN
jgi:hypothetical protein